jgi:hypothetical protein
MNPISDPNQVRVSVIRDTDYPGIEVAIISHTLELTIMHPGSFNPNEYRRQKSDVELIKEAVEKYVLEHDDEFFRNGETHVCLTETAFLDGKVHKKWFEVVRVVPWKIRGE